METPKLTPAYRAVLHHLSSTPDRKAVGESCRRAAGLTHRGWRIVEGRMANANLISRIYEKGSPVAMTRLGARAVGDTW